MALASACLLFGQGLSGNGSVTGRVTDASGATVEGADVTLTDPSTSITLKSSTNPSGIYIFNNISPGTYEVAVTKSGFRKAVIANQPVSTGAALTLDVKLEVGATTEILEVVSTPGAELQTENATMGTTLGNDTIMNLPIISRDVSALTFLQATAAPTFGGAEGNTTSGNIAGNMADQNSFMLDGGNNTSDLDGDNATYIGRNGAGVMPTPSESVEEFRVNTNNLGADFGASGGAQVQVNTKRGTNQFHGSAYDYFQSDVLASNDWYNNFHAIDKPKSHYNRFGGSIGGPIAPSFLGGKTYFYANYEGERYPRSGPIEKPMPSDSLRQGIIKIRDASGNVISYNLATATVCGPNGNQPCDPRGQGINPVVSKLWSTYMPECNDLSGGDHNLNTCGYIGNLSYPLSNNFGVARVDHDFGDKWRFFGTFRYFGQNSPTTSQVDVGGLQAGDTKGQYAAASTNVNQPRSLVAGVTGTISPTLTNEFHVSYLRNDWNWIRSGAQPQIAGIPGALGVGGESSSALIPINIDTQSARQRTWDGHDYDYRDTMTWLLGTHMLQFGGDFLHNWYHFDRYDNVVGGLTQLVYGITNSGINFDGFNPVACSDAVTTNCVPSTSLGTYQSYFAQLTGIVSSTSVVATRSGANLSLNPLGSPVRSYVTDQSGSAFISDSWKVRPNLTINLGLNYTLQMPPRELNGSQDILTLANGQVLTAETWLKNVQNAAQNGQVYNPTIGFTPIGATKGLNGYPYAPFYGGVAPRVSVAWSPKSDVGWLAKVLGDKSTVIRAGYGRYYSRSLGIDLVSTPVLGDGFLQPVGCSHPNTAGECTSPGAVSPATAFRIGTDGNAAPVGAIPQTLTVPVTPGVNAAYATLVAALDNNFRPGVTDNVDISIQRQLPNNMILEVSYVGNFGRHLFQGVDLGNVPWMMKQGGQTFAQAYAAMYTALAAGKTPAAQPFFETALGGTGYCNGAANCTAKVAANESGNILSQSVTNLWSDLDTTFKFGPALLSTTQCFYCYADTSLGYSNYNALTATVQKRYSKGLTLNANFTYGKSMGTIALNQAYTLNNVNNPWDLRTDYGPQFWDRKFTFNLLGSYTLPFGKGQKWQNNNPVVSRLISGWTVSPIFSMGTGLPLSVYTGSYQELGNAFDGNGCNAIPLSGMSYSNSPHFGITSNGTVGVNGDAANAGSGVNMYANPAAVYSNFRPYILGIDGNCGGGGILRGQARWNLDLGLTKDTRITERVGAQLYVQAFNVLNHMMWGDPSMNLQDPADFGVLSGQYNAITLGGAGASANYTRIIQIGLRISF
jgi:hypothetical protein